MYIMANNLTALINPRKYGRSPFSIAVIHGGPGAPGEMAPVARELSENYGVLEPLQTYTSLEGQVQELKEILEKYAQFPLVLIGHSWGAFLSFIFTAHYPAFVKKLILVGSGPFEAKYAKGIMGTRLSRLSEKERTEVQSIFINLKDPSVKNKNILFARFGILLAKADQYDAIVCKNEVLECDNEIFQRVWTEAEKLRSEGKLLELCRDIKCPVIAVHGDYDPHPAEGVRKPLSSTLPYFKFILLKNCGHDPWIERKAKDRFYTILRKEINSE